MNHDELHRQAIKRYGEELRAMYMETVQAATQYMPLASLNKNDAFYFRSNPQVNERVDNLVDLLFKNVQTHVVQSVYSEWDRAVEKNNTVVEKVFGATLSTFPPEYIQKYLSGNEQAREAFLLRKKQGLQLSDRVWVLKRQFKQELELALESGITRGRGAAQTAAEIQQYLNEPDKLFRRVRDEHGVLRLSKAAALYNPGQGVYRSSYKNAFRLVRNETSFSYQKSNQLKYAQQDFTVGMEIRVSPNHNPEDDKGGIECIKLQGKYPKTFDWTYKWHVNCLCMSLSIQKTPEEIKEDVRRILRGEEPLPASSSKNYVAGLPSNYIELANEYSERFSRYKTYPRTFAANMVPEEQS